MANLARIRVAWSGAGVTGPGLSTFYFDEAGGGWTAALSSMFDAMKNRFPVGITWVVPSTGDLVDVATGDLSGIWNTPGGSTIVSTGGNGFVRGAGGRIEWGTAGLRNGRRVQGSTFLCPLDNGCWSGTGEMNETARSALSSSANTFFGAVGSQLRIYSRPTASAPGLAHLATSAYVPGTVSWLRSRRT